MDTYLKLGSVKKNKNCNCITPFYISDIKGINPNTGRNYTTEDRDAIKTALYRISNAKGCNVSVCCDPNDPTSMPDAEFTRQFKKKYRKIMPMYNGNVLEKILLSSNGNVAEAGWQDPSTYFICKITKAKITDTEDPNIKVATELVNDCFNDNCNSVETITVNNILQNSKADMKYSYFDDARVVQSILEGNISYVKEYIRKYKQVNMPLTNDDYNNRLIHIATGSSYNDILTMLIALKANLNIQNKFGETPMHFAVQAKKNDNINSLVGQGIDLTLTNNNGETAMFYAMKTGDMQIVNMLYQNNSPIMNVDNKGNNLIHYCILNCPTFNEDDDSVPNTKGEIIQFLINHGLSTEAKNNAGITPLELVSQQIKKEAQKDNNRVCAKNIENDKQEVIEKFFNIRPIREAFTETLSTGATSQDISSYSPEHISLLDIQSKLFNNIISNNPEKYSGYISVNDLPKGSPIDVLDTVCVGDNITGNEDSEECIAKGGKISKIKNATTKIKLELTPNEESATDAVSQKDLYYPKINKKVPIGTVPQSISSYNASVKAGGNILPIPTMTKGITYTLGQNATNELITPTNTISTIATTITPTTTIAPTIAMETTVDNAGEDEHPSILSEENDVVYKCKKEAIDNSIKIATKNTNPEISPFTDMNISRNMETLYTKYKTHIHIILAILIILIAYFIIL